jgi:hypothetical protein
MEVILPLKYPDCCIRYLENYKCFQLPPKIQKVMDAINVEFRISPCPRCAKIVIRTINNYLNFDPNSNIIKINNHY